MSKTIKTGNVVSVSGQYKARGCKSEVTFVKGNRVPPTTKGTTKFTLVDVTKHKGAR